jgi:RNA-directed DNA polymerase
MLWSWARRRHQNKGLGWIRRRYFRADGYWTFYSKDAELVRITATPIRRFVKISGRNSPFDPKLRAYWQARTERYLSEQTASKQKLAVLQRQQGKCAMCGMLFATTAEAHIHHIIPQAQGGSEDLSNKRVVHYWCHQQQHQRSGSRVLTA